MTLVLHGEFLHRSLRGRSVEPLTAPGGKTLWEAIEGDKCTDLLSPTHSTGIHLTNVVGSVAGSVAGV